MQVRSTRHAALRCFLGRRTIHQMCGWVGICFRGMEGTQASLICKASHADSFPEHPEESIKPPQSENNSKHQLCGNVWSNFSFPLHPTLLLPKPEQKPHAEQNTPLPPVSSRHLPPSQRWMGRKYHHQTRDDFISLVHAKPAADEKLQTKGLISHEDQPKATSGDELQPGPSLSTISSRS